MGKDEENRVVLYKYAAISGVLLAMTKAYSDLRKLTIKDVVESNFFRRWRAFNSYLVTSGWYPKYQPTGLNGQLMDVPSKSSQVFASPPATKSDSKILRPFKLRGLTLRNRIIRAAAFDGEREEEIIKTHTDQSKGGVAMTTVAYCCVSKEGLTFEGQLIMEDSRREFLKRLTSEVHKYGGAISAQLTHAGGFADRSVTGIRQLAPSSVFNIAGFDWPKEMTLKDLEEMKSKFAKAARFAKECGFDCIELHVGHGYLLSQFLCPQKNVRTDKYGGNAENRARFPAEVLKSCRKAVGEDYPIVAKLNMHDGHYNGLELSDAVVAANALIDASADALILTCGSITLNGFYMLRGALPIEKLAQALPSPAEKLAVALFGPLAIPQTEYDDCFLRESAREVKRLVGNRVPICLMGGVSSLSAMEGAMDEGFELVQIARSLIREPDLVNRIIASLELNEEDEGARDKPIDDVKSKCIRCNLCVIATVDPKASFGCPFQKMDAKRRIAKGIEPVLSIEGMKDVLRSEKQILSMNPTRGITTVDIEDLCGSSKAKL